MVVSPRPTFPTNRSDFKVNYTAQILINVQNADGVDNEYLEQMKQQIQDYLSFEGETVTVAVAVQEPMVDNVGVPTIKTSPPAE